MILKKKEYLVLGVAVIVLFYISTGVYAYRGKSQGKSQDVTFNNISNKIPFNRDSLALGGDGLGGVAWFDYNNDGLEDLFLTNGVGNSNALFKNNGDGNFEDVTEISGLSGGTGNSSVIAADFDNDGHSDLFLTGDGGLFGVIEETPLKIYRNLGDGTFSDETEASGIIPPRTHLTATSADIDNDGDLDIFVGAPGSLTPQIQDQSALYLNNGDFTFSNITAEAGIDAALGACVVGFSDYDRDQDQDLFVGNCNNVFFQVTPVQLFKNDGTGSFVDATTESRLDQELGVWMSMTFGDYDNDGNIDIFLTNAGNFSILPDFFLQPHHLMRNNGDGTFSSVGEEAGVANSEFGWGASAADFNNDGWLDIFFVGNWPPSGTINAEHGNPGRLHMNDGHKHSGLLSFTDKSENVGFNFSTSYASGVAIGDPDDNGFYDLAVIREKFLDPGSAVLLENEANKNRWIAVKLKGTESNTDAVGARVEFYSRRGVQVREVYAGAGYGSTDTKKLIFGLGRFRIGGFIKVGWPSGMKELFPAFRTGKTYTLIEGSGYRIK